MTRTIIILAALTALTFTACTPAQQAAWKAMSPQERENYVAHLEGRSPYETAGMGESVDDGAERFACAEHCTGEECV